MDSTCVNFYFRVPISSAVHPVVYRYIVLQYYKCNVCKALHRLPYRVVDQQI